MPKLSVREIASENANRLKDHFMQFASLRYSWREVKPFITKYRPVFIKGKKGTYVMDATKMGFEALIGIRLSMVYGKNLLGMFDMRLALLRNTNAISIQAIQGITTRKRWNPLKRTPLANVRDFEATTGMPAANYLVEELRRHAKHVGGFTHIRLIKPENIPAYRSPALTLIWKDKIERKVAKGTSYEDAREEAFSEIRKKMKKFYYSLAKEMNFVDKGEYWELEI
jgi:hypothetical protein